MMKLGSDVEQVLTGQSFWHLATINPDGSPQVSPIWAHVRDGKVVINSNLERRKTRNIAADSRVSLAWHDPEDPYHHVLIKGQVVETITGPTADEDIDMLADKYIGQTPYPFRAEGEVRVTFLIEPLHVSVSG
jgi:PPOX class probable F420-dependent enzyme